MASLLKLGRRAAPWAVLTLALILATFPAWRLVAFGYEPTLEDLLTLRCFGL
jgi:hypothetical protein